MILLLLYWLLGLVVLAFIIWLIGWKTLSCWLHGFKDYSSAIEAFGAILLIATFLMYWEANELNRKATIIAHTPWLKINEQIRVEIMTDPNGGKWLRLATQVENTSDSPMLNLSGLFKAFSTDENPDPAKDPYVGETIINLMPHDSIWIQNKLDGTSIGLTPEQLGVKIASGELTVRILTSYQDIFKDNLKEYMDVESLKDGSNTFFMKRTNVTGFVTY